MHKEQKMRLPLIVHASPSVKKTPLVLLREGEWVVESNVKDTQFYINVSGERYTKKFNAKHGDAAQLVIEKAGTEQQISIDLVKVS